MGMSGRITIDLIRKSADHNSGEVSTLEELSLHQRNITKLDLIDNACRKLKILYLQNNLIPKIENVSRCKELNYLNMALNNVAIIEGLEGCEMLEKLDLTVNFIGDLRSVKSLACNRCLKQMYLTGNPCAMYDGYREYVVAVLPQLKNLDGHDITRSERILAVQGIEETTRMVNKQSLAHVAKELAKKEKAAAKQARKELNEGGWYTNTTAEHTTKKKEPPKIVEIDSDASESDLDDEEAQDFWAEESEFSPESRVEAALMTERQERMKEKSKGEKKKKARNMKKVNYFRKDGKPYNMNEGGWQFWLDGQGEEDGPYKLDLGVYKHLDTSAIDLDVNPNYVRIIIKEKVFQLHLPMEVCPDHKDSKAERSKITGRLEVTMVKMDQVAKKVRSRPFRHVPGGESRAEEKARKDAVKPVRLEVGEGLAARTDHTTIIADAEAAMQSKRGILTVRSKGKAAPRANDEDFVDDDDVPPLE